jgi:phage gpG-like protein
MAVLRGDFGALEDLQRRIREVSSSRFRQELAHRLAGTAIKLLADEFRQSRDPYGNPWKPVNRNRARDRRARSRRAASGRAKRGDLPLIDSGRLRAAATSAAADLSTGDLVRISIPVDYASYHQYGTRRMAKRQIIPDANKLGPIWSDAFRKEIEKKLRETVVP